MARGIVAEEDCGALARGIVNEEEIAAPWNTGGALARGIVDEEESAAPWTTGGVVPLIVGTGGAVAVVAAR